jgi:hypothetical protein
MARKVYVSTLPRSDRKVGGHIVTPKIWNSLYWAERTVYHQDGYEIHLSRPKELSLRKAKEAANRMVKKWVEAGCPTHKEMSDAIRKQNTMDVGGRKRSLRFIRGVNHGISPGRVGGCLIDLG